MARTVIHGRLADLYDATYRSKGYERESGELLRRAVRYLGERTTSLLDVGCGTGVHLSYFRRHLDVAGVDRSADMLRVARKRLGPEVRLVRGDMRRFSLRTSFDVVTCLFSAIGYMERRSDRDRAIANFYRHLRPGGVALVEGWVRPERWRGTSVDAQTLEDGGTRGARVVSAWREGDRSVIEFQWLVADRGRKIRRFSEVVRMPLVPPDEMLGSFRRAGFRAHVEVDGPYRDRGLFIGVRPRTRERGPAGPRSTVGAGAPSGRRTPRPGPPRRGKGSGPRRRRV